MRVRSTVLSLKSRWRLGLLGNQMPPCLQSYKSTSAAPRGTTTRALAQPKRVHLQMLPRRPLAGGGSWRPNQRGSRGWLWKGRETRWIQR